MEAFGNFHADRDTFSSNGAVNYGGALELATDSSTHGQISTITNSTFDSNYTNCHRVAQSMSTRRATMAPSRSH